MRVNIYIRNADKAKWDAITDKPEFIHAVLNDRVYTHIDKLKSVSIHTPAQAKAVVGKDNDTCPHGFAWGLCKKSACNTTYNLKQAT